MSSSGDSTASQLQPLLLDLRAALDLRPLDEALLRRSLESLLVFLSSPEGRTDANVVDTDAFMLAYDLDRGWSHVPDGLAQILEGMAGALHDTIGAPEIATNFGSTPEQLLARLRAI